MAIEERDLENVRPSGRVALVEVGVANAAAGPVRAGIDLDLAETDHLSLVVYLVKTGDPFHAFHSLYECWKCKLKFSQPPDRERNTPRFLAVLC